MKVAILSISCDRDRHNGWQQGIRDTWFAQWREYVDCKFVVGSDFTFCDKDDELLVKADDSYGGMVYKTRAAFRWADRENYDYVFVSFADTYVAVPRLLAALPVGEDYVGCQVPDSQHLSGGAGYWLSRKAFVYLGFCRPSSDYEDRWAGHCLEAGGFKRVHDPRYTAPPYDGPPFNGDWSDGRITVHLGRGTDKYDPQWMRDCHRSYLDDAALRIS